MCGTGGNVASSKRNNATLKCGPARRHALATAPLPPVCNYRTVHAVKRWGGVFVNDNFGESPARVRKQLKNWIYEGVEEPVTAYDQSFYVEDFALWERISVER